MHTHRLDNLLLKPSLFSGIICTLFAATVPVAVNWTYVLKNVLFYDYFLGPDGLVTSLRNQPSGASTVSNVLASKSLGHNMLILMGALAAGLGIFLAVKIVSNLIRSVSITLKEVHAVETPAKHIVERELSRRIIIRLIVAAIWVVYTIISIKVILPFAILASQIGLSENSPISTGIYYTLFAGGLLFLALHAHVIMARLLLLKARVFGGEDAILSE